MSQCIELFLWRAVILLSYFSVKIVKFLEVIINGKK
nr:MAG TPA: hypothetical protein [Caudoviricetes sp.]